MTIRIYNNTEYRKWKRDNSIFACCDSLEEIRQVKQQFQGIMQQCSPYVSIEWKTVYSLKIYNAVRRDITEAGIVSRTNRESNAN